VPKSPHTGQNGSSTNPDHWARFDQAVAAQHKHNFDGIGFALDHSRVPLVGIDLDHCIVDGQLTPLAREIVDTVNAYCEVTPSGAGLRIFAIADLPPGKRKHTGKGVEMYDSARYLTVTGNHLAGTPTTIEHRADEVHKAYRLVFGDPEPLPPPPTPVQPTNLDDMQLLQVAMSARNGDKFTELWNGNWQGNGWNSQSDADLALCNLLAFYTGKDAHRMDGLFRQSGLMRDKWDRRTGNTTYGRMTIERAIADTREVYTGPADISVSDIILMGTDQTEADTTGPGCWADLEGILGPVEWDWPGWIAKGFQTMVTSYAGEGKSNLILHIAKTYLTGCPWPDGIEFTGDPGKVLWCETESAQALNYARAIEWGLPVESILTPLADPLEDVSLDDTDHQAAILRVGQHPEVKAIIVDSLSGGTIKEAKSSNEMGRVGKFLAGIAKYTAKPVIVTHHLNKPNRNFKQDRITLDRVRDSSAIVQYARLVWAIDAPDAELAHQKRLYIIKSNLGEFPQPLGFVVTATGLVFGDAPQQPKRQTELERARQWLLEILQDGPVLAKEVYELAAAENIAKSTLERAKKDKNVVSTKEAGIWHWKRQELIETIII
jgi:hypothetical protein